MIGFQMGRAAQISDSCFQERSGNSCRQLVGQRGAEDNSQRAVTAGGVDCEAVLTLLEPLSERQVMKDQPRLVVVLGFVPTKKLAHAPEPRFQVLLVCAWIADTQALQHCSLGHTMPTRLDHLKHWPHPLVLV